MLRHISSLEFIVVDATVPKRLLSAEKKSFLPVVDVAEPSTGVS